MDVRCEKCGTEYELDEARLKPGGVTVKCTSCGHMFKIRKRSPTNVGVPAVAPGTLAPAPSAPPPAPRPTGAQRAQTQPAAGVPRPMTQTGSEPTAERNWIIRLANGEQRSCRELATLQQWIIAGEVNRESMISRSGKTWKQLGDIPELAQFFTVAEQARTRRDSARVTSEQDMSRSRAPTPVADKGTLLGIPTAPPAPPPAPVSKAMPSLAGPPANDGKPKPAAAARTAQMTTKNAAGAPVAAPAAPTMLSAPVAPPPAPPAPAPPPSPPATFSKPAAPPPTPARPPPKLAAADASARSTGAWANADVRQLVDDSAEGFGGKVRMDSASAEPAFSGRIASVPTHDAAFVAGRSSGLSQPMPQSADEPMLEDDLIPQRSGGIGKWIALGALAVIAGAAIAVWMVLRPTPKASGAGGGSGTSAKTTTKDAGAAAATPDAKTAEHPLTPEDDALVGEAHDSLAADVAPGLEQIATQLAAGEQGGARLALRARVATALAQELEDQAAIAPDAKAADKLRKDAKKHVADALPLAQKAAKVSPDDAGVHVAMADVLRLQSRPAKDVQKEIDRALAIAPDDREALLVSALLAAREKKADDARTILVKLDSGDGAMEQSGDVRPRFRLAMLSFAGGDAPAATKAAEDVLALQAEHAGAQALVKRLRDSVAVTDPMPPEEDGNGKKPPDHGSGTGTGTGTGSSSHTGDSEPKGDYDALLKKADSLAEVNCSNAMPYYAKALELKPNGVGALAGRGYCYIDAKSFSSAFSSFRAALAVSPRYEPALWGMAEAYQQQGLKDKAIEAYMKYLEVYPSSAKAKKQIERLGGTVPSEGGGGDEPSHNPADEPKPDEPKPDEPKPDEPKPDDPAPSP